MRTGATKSVMVGVSNWEEGLKLFRDTMGFEVEWENSVHSSQLDHWGIDPGVSGRICELSAKGYPLGRVHLAHFTPSSSKCVRLDDGDAAQDSPLDIGPKAIDFYVRNPINKSFDALKAAGYHNRSFPRKHTIGQSISEEVLFTGPNGLPMLIMVGHKHPEVSLRLGSPEGDFSELATCSVICGDLEQSRIFYEKGLGLIPVNDAETGAEFRDLVCDLVDAPAGTRVHFLLYAAPDEPSGKILLIYFHTAEGKRLVDRMRPGHLGFSLFTHDTNCVIELYEKLVAIGANVIAPPKLIILPTGEQKLSILAKGPNEEMFEFLSNPPQKTV